MAFINKLWANKPRLPNTYQQVEYIESTAAGLQYINTNFIISQDDVKIETEFTKSSVSTNAFPYAIYSSGTTTCNINMYGGAGGCQLYLRMLGFDTGGIEVTQPTSDFAHVEVTTSSYKYNDLEGTVTPASGATFVGNQSKLILFAQPTNASGTSVQNHITGKMKKFKLSYGDNVQLDLIPCYRKVDHKPGMYDAISRTFFVSQSASDFVLGEDVHTLPDIYQEVKYLQSTGEQYLELNYKATNNTNYEIKFNTTDSTRVNYIFGDRVTTSAKRCTIHHSTNKGVYINISSDSDHKCEITPALSFNEDHTIVRNNDKVYVDGTEYNFPLTETFECTSNAKLFASSLNGSVSSALMGSERIHYFKMSDTAWSVDLVPCYRKEDNKPGMYDLVNEVFYTNQGTGNDFIIGPVVSNLQLIDALKMKNSSGQLVYPKMYLCTVIEGVKQLVQIYGDEPTVEDPLVGYAITGSAVIQH